MLYEIKITKKLSVSKFVSKLFSIVKCGLDIDYKFIIVI